MMDMSKMNMAQMSSMSSEDMMLKMMNKRFWIAILLCSPLLILGIMSDFFHKNYLSASYLMWLQLLISIPVVFWCGWMFFTKAGKGVIHGKLNMFTLVVMGVLSAWLFSIFAMFFPNDFPISFHLPNGGVAVYFDAACYITIIVLLGHVWEMKGRKRINDDIANLQAKNEKLHPHLGNIMNNVNTKPLEIQKYIDKVAENFILFVIILALTTFFIWFKFGPNPSALYGLIISITVLLSACPCVFTLATPLSIMCGINKGAQNGILIKNSDIFQSLSRMDIDKNKSNLSEKGSILNLSEKGITIKFAMGTNNSQAIQDADVILLNNDSKDVDNAIKLSVLTMNNIKENIIIGLAYNFIMLPIAAGILYPYWGILLGPVTASFAMSISSIVVVLNAFRIKEYRLK